MGRGQLEQFPAAVQVSCTARRCRQMIELRYVVARAGRTLSFIVSGSCLATLAVIMSCAPPTPASPTAPPAGATVQAAGTRVGATVGAVATVQTGGAQPTV